LKKYEAIFILEIRKVEDEGKAFTEEIKSLIEGWNGKLEEAIPMGRKQFAREIKKRKAGIYWNYIFTCPAEKIIEIKNKYRLDERVLRNMIIIYDKPEVAAQEEKAV
jgi:small subunit ribosomal protein S6